MWGSPMPRPESGWEAAADLCTWIQMQTRHVGAYPANVTCVSKLVEPGTGDAVEEGRPLPDPTSLSMIERPPGGGRASRERVVWFVVWSCYGLGPKVPDSLSEAFRLSRCDHGILSDLLGFRGSRVRMPPSRLGGR